MQPGDKVYWNPPYRRFIRYVYMQCEPRYKPIARVVSVQKHTAHIEVTRYDGKRSMRYIKIDRLTPVA